MSFSERELEKYGDHFLVGLEAIGRVLGLYPAEHPNVAAQCQRLLDSIKELRDLSGQSVFSFVNAELYVNGVPLKRLSLTHQKPILAWEQRGVGQISFDAEVTPAELLAFHSVVTKSREELRAAGGAVKLLADLGVTRIRAGRVAVGMEADKVAMVDGDVAAHPETAEGLDLEGARKLYREAFLRLLVAVQGAAAVDPRVRMIRNLSQLIEARLLERRLVRDLAARLREHHKESYRHALGGAVIAVLMGSAIGVGGRRLRLLGEAALLRDVGKLSVAPDVLDGRDRDPQARAEYERHPAHGARLLFATREIDPTAAIVAFEHHAGLDRKGFPALRARSAPHPITRLVAVASDYDRMTGGYPGVEMTSVWDAVQRLVQGIGRAYDAAAVRSFLAVCGLTPEGSPVRLVDERQGIVVGPGPRSWLSPEVALLRDAQGGEIGPEIVATDGLAAAGVSAIAGFGFVNDRDRERLEALRDLD